MKTEISRAVEGVIAAGSADMPAAFAAAIGAVARGLMREVELIEQRGGEIVDGLEKRIVELEKRPALVYRGTHVQGQMYEPGDAVTRSGSLWVAEDATNETPGNGATAWRLAVKR